MRDDDTIGTERILGRVLGVGTHISTLLLALGLAYALIDPGAPALGLLHAGLVMLMATPVLRVAVSVIAFARRREWWFVACTSIVLALITSGVLAVLAE